MHFEKPGKADKPHRSILKAAENHFLNALRDVSYETLKSLVHFLKKLVQLHQCIFHLPTTPLMAKMARWRRFQIRISNFTGMPQLLSKKLVAARKIDILHYVFHSTIGTLVRKLQQTIPFTFWNTKKKLSTEWKYSNGICRYFTVAVWHAVSHCGEAVITLDTVQEKGGISLHCALMEWKETFVGKRFVPCRNFVTQASAHNKDIFSRLLPAASRLIPTTNQKMSRNVANKWNIDNVRCVPIKWLVLRMYLVVNVFLVWYVLWKDFDVLSVHLCIIVWCC